ncbi:hypothetical protein BCR34DRAFT_370993 [Clohesyomyces aquaticus]|uniref:Ecp2 effector protein-like domain-containing protein n=1 Tax=Clohesyomyces aquaticus TaxID=1231657 RepID=A0A1Y1ZHD5_9PLEO|nr:hypothetical protein BCR34DRAFT_370993 [Clohesyomyces aquaticus]
MKVQVISLFALLSPLTVAIDYCAGDESIGRDCDTLTYVDVTTSASSAPKTSECQDTCRGILTDAGDWIVDMANKPAGYVQHMASYPCAFSVTRPPGDTTSWTASMTNQDMVSILDEVSKRFGSLHGGRVAANGTMRCTGHTVQWFVD